MILTAIKHYIQTHQQATVFQIAKHFDLKPAIAKDMLCCWERKGCIRKGTKTPACGTKCKQCDQWMVETYEWVS